MGSEMCIRDRKYEEVYLNEYETFSDALDNIAHFIEDVYNKKRLHSARVPLPHRLREGKGDGNGEGGENTESFKYCFLTSCILTGVHPNYSQKQG